jgi:hypothetical protein
MAEIPLEILEAPVMTGAMIAYLVAILTVPLISLTVGYLTVAARPLDPNAWFVLTLLTFSRNRFWRYPGGLVARHPLHCVRALESRYSWADLSGAGMVRTAFPRAFPYRQTVAAVEMGALRYRGLLPRVPSPASVPAELRRWFDIPSRAN